MLFRQCDTCMLPQTHLFENAGGKATGKFFPAEYNMAVFFEMIICKQFQKVTIKVILM